MKTKVKFRLSSKFQKNYMSLRGWSVNDLAEQLEYKKQQVSQTLSGSIEPTMTFLHRLCHVTKLRIEDVVETVFEK